MFYASFYLVLNLFYLFIHQTMICNKPHKYPLAHILLTGSI